MLLVELARRRHPTTPISARIDLPIDLSRKRPAPVIRGMARSVSGRMVKLSARRRQCEAEARPVARRALSPDPPIVRFDQLPYDRQTQPGSAGGPRPRAVGTVEALEDIRQVLGRDASAIVANGDDDER